MPSSDTQFKKEENPRRKGLPVVTEPLAEKPLGVRLFAADLAALENIKDRSGFIRAAVAEKVEREGLR